MAATAQVVHVALETYLSSTFEPDAEYVDGVIEERPMGEFDHSSWQHALELWFGSRAKEWGIRARPELRVQVSAGNFRVPDVVILDRTLPVEQIITHAPIAVFEILSPEDTLTRMMAKLADYEGMGIATIIVLDPHGQHSRFKNGKLEPLGVAPFQFDGSACRFDLGAIQELLD